MRGGVFNTTVRGRLLEEIGCGHCSEGRLIIAWSAAYIIQASLPSFLVQFGCENTLSPVIINVHIFLDRMFNLCFEIHGFHMYCDPRNLKY